MLSYFRRHTYTTDTGNWGLAAALGLLMLVTTLVLYAAAHKLSGGRDGGGWPVPPWRRWLPGLSARWCGVPAGAHRGHRAALIFPAARFLTYPLPGLSLRWYDEVLGGGHG